MKIISWNTSGLNDKSKQTALKHFIQSQHPDLVMIQETKCPEFDQQLITRQCGVLVEFLVESDGPR